MAVLGFRLKAGCAGNLRRLANFPVLCFFSLFVPSWFKKLFRNAMPWMTLFEAKKLFDLVKGNPGRGVIVEIGSAWGGGSCLLSVASQQSDSAMVYCVDPWPALKKPVNFSGSCDRKNFFSWDNGFVFSLPAGSMLARFKENVARYGVKELVNPIKAKSVDAAKSWPKKEIRFLFIDGSHEYKDVVADIRAWGPFLARGGIIAFHDYFPENSVWRAVSKSVVVSSGRFSALNRVGSLAWAKKIN